MARAQVNPGYAPNGKSNVILAGSGRYHYVPDFPGPLSIKSIIRGQASWTTQEGRFVLDADSILVLNHRQPYTILIDTPRPIQTFCLFFRDGLIDDAWRCHTQPAERMLDDPANPAPAGGFFERI